MNLEDRIRYEGESTTLDFKKSYYAAPTKTELISDVMAMANADTKDDRVIVFGVKHCSDGSKTFHSLSSFPDPADIEQLLLQNIEPAVHVEFCPFEYDGHTIAYLRIYDCNDQPYLMRKDHGVLTQGTGRIRKGTTTLPLLRTDIDRMFAAKNEKQDLRQFINIQWAGNPPSREIDIRRPKNATFPSKVEAAKIQGYIDKLERIEFEKKNPRTGPIGSMGVLAKMAEQAEQIDKFYALSRSLSNLGVPGYGTSQDPYLGLTLDQLKARLQRVPMDFINDDEFYIYTELGAAINLQILNTGPQYLDDAVLILTIPNDERLKVASKTPRKPARSSYLSDLKLQNFAYKARDQLVYPSVETTEEAIIVQAQIKQLQNGVPREAFVEPLHVVLHREVSPELIPVRLKLVARGLQSPFEDVLFIRPV
jgi:hypothetical protein